LGELILPGGTSGPALARSEGSTVGPAHGVLTRSTVGVGNTASPIGPERVEVAIAGSLLARGDTLSLLQITGKRKGTNRRTGCNKKACE